MRQVGDADLARDITQTTFIILAKKASTFDEGTILSGWLYRTAQYAAASVLRTERRRREREQEAMKMQLDPEPGHAWEKLAPLLDQAMTRLNAADRNAVLLRYFENKTAREVGLTMGVNESTAQKRIARAVEKLRGLCTRRGVILPAAALTAMISANSVQAAPAGLAVSTAALATGGGWGAPTAMLVKGTLKLAAWAKYKMAVTLGIGLLVASGTAVLLEWQDLFPPQYQGRTLATWLAQLDDKSTENPTVLPWKNLRLEANQTSQQAEAIQAIHSFGPQAFPRLLAELEQENGRSSGFFHASEPQAYVRRHRAALAFEALGPEGEPMVKELKRVLYESENPKESARALAAIGPAGWEVLSDAITNTESPVGACAIWALGTHQASVPGAVDKLKAFLEQDVNDGITGLAGWALVKTGADRQEVVSLLARELDSRRVDTRFCSAVSLGQMGPEARGAVPALLAHLKDPDKMVRHDAAQALEQIDPAVAAQAGVTGALASEHVPVTRLELPFRKK